jgi:hypothetical protein
VDVVAARLGTAMMHQVDLKMARHGFIPGDCPHGNAARHAIGLFGAAARQARRILDEAGQPPLDAGNAHGVQLPQQYVGHKQFAVRANNGVIQITGVASRRIGYVVAAILAM